jgi:DNA gyrase inhibitor GyrI
MDNTLINPGDQKQYSISIEVLPPYRVACCRAVSATPEEESSARLTDWFNRHGIKNNRHFGFDVEVSPDQSSAGLRGYEVWQDIPEGVEGSEDVVIREFPGGMYAVITLVNPFTDPFIAIPTGWKDLHNWVIQSNQYRGANHQWLEELIAHDDAPYDLKLLHPIVAV